MIEYIRRIAFNFGQYFRQDIKNCFKAFDIELVPLTSLDMKKRVKELNKQNKKNAFSRTYEKIMSDEICVIHREKKDIRVYYDLKMLNKESINWKHAMTHEFAHFLFHHITPINKHFTFYCYSLPDTIGLNENVKMIHDEVKNSMYKRDETLDWEPLEYDQELVANLFAFYFLTPMHFEYDNDGYPIDVVTKEYIPINIFSENLMRIDMLKFYKQRNLTYDARFRPFISDRIPHDPLKLNICKIIKKYPRIKLKDLYQKEPLCDIDKGYIKNRFNQIKNIF